MRLARANPSGPRADKFKPVNALYVRASGATDSYGVSAKAPPGVCDLANGSRGHDLRTVLSCAFSSAMLGIDGYVVRVETDSSPGVPAFAIIGLPDRALNESRERVRAPIINSGLGFPPGRLLVNLAPPISARKAPASISRALAPLATDEQIEAAALRDFLALGELALDGSVRSVPGLLAMMIAAKNAGFANVIVPG